jgi:hypothetical protein
MGKAFDIMEELVDKFGVRDTMLMLSDVISAKADHIAGNWQDEGLARQWVKAGQVVRKAVRELPKGPGIK